jgi:hypothetical protein
MRIGLHHPHASKVCPKEGTWERITFRGLGVIALLGLSACSLPWASTQPQSELSSKWHIYASCAAAYQADWQLRQAHRSHDMSNMIQEQVEDYKAKAAGFYETELKVQLDDARRIVESFVSSNVDQFAAMERAGTLEAYIDRCPPE